VRNLRTVKVVYWVNASESSGADSPSNKRTCRISPAQSHDREGSPGIAEVLR